MYQCSVGGFVKISPRNEKNCQGEVSSRLHSGYNLEVQSLHLPDAQPWTMCLAIVALLTPSATPAEPRWTELRVLGETIPRAGCSAVFNPRNRQVLVFGGVVHGEKKTQNDLLEAYWDADVSAPLVWRCRPVEGLLPPPRKYHTAVYDEKTDRMIVFGGFASELHLLNDVWVLENAAQIAGKARWKQLHPTGVVPAPRASHSAVYDPYKNHMIVFGGCIQGRYGCDIPQSDLWVLSDADGEAGAPRWLLLETAGTVPGRRANHSASQLGSSGAMLVLGGAFEGGGHWNDVWLLNRHGPGTLFWTPVTIPGRSPPGRWGHVSFYNEAENYILLFGGTRIRSDGADLWILDNADGTGGIARWRLIDSSSTRPSARSKALSVFDSQRNVWLIFGGVYGETLSWDAWVLNVSPLAESVNR